MMITILKRTTMRSAAISAAMPAAIMAVAALALAPVAATAQDQPAQAQGAESGDKLGDTAEQQAVPGGGEDFVIARVGDADIMRSEVMGVIAMLPQNMQEQPAETLVPLAVEQLILHELILQEARAAGMENDPDVEALLADAPADAPGDARENAMVQVWLDRELEGAVTDQAVQDTYGTVQSELGDQVPPLDQIRPQIEEEVRRQAFLDLSRELHADGDVTLLGPDGEVLE